MQINASVPSRAVVPPRAAREHLEIPHENAVKRFLEHAFHPTHLYKNPAAKAPANPAGLKIASYNIQLGGIHLDQAYANLKAMDADVICLQETTRESAEAIAKRLGMHCYFASSRMYLDDKAILSKYPITATEDHGFGDSAWSRFKAYLRGIPKGGITATEPIGRRSCLHVTLQVGSHTVDVLDPHLSAADHGASAKQIDNLAGLAKQLEAKGHTVLIAGDFNTNFSGTPGPAAQTLNGALQNFWDKAQRREALSGGKLVTPEEAQGKPGLERVAAGVSHLGANKRLDSVFASDDLQITRAFIDQDHAGSDHQPIMAEVRFLGNS